MDMARGHSYLVRPLVLAQSLHLRAVSTAAPCPGPRHIWLPWSLSCWELAEALAVILALGATALTWTGSGPLGAGLIRAAHFPKGPTDKALTLCV